MLRKPRNPKSLCSDAHFRFSGLLAGCFLLSCVSRLHADNYLLKNGTIVDGSGKPAFKGDIRISNGRIVALGRLVVSKEDVVIDAVNMVVSPGFIDAHSHAPAIGGSHADLVIKQGITTVISGQDGSHEYPLSSLGIKRKAKPTPYNVASFAGHGTIRMKVLGKNYKRKATAKELGKMAALIGQEMRAGALGLSSGLEYDPGFYSNTVELIACAKAASKYGGIYISHMRNEDNEAFKAISELLEISENANIPAQISHIKLGSKAVWGRAPEVLQLMADARGRGLDISADVYPYLYWQSSIVVLIPSRNWADRAAWQKGLEDIGGPSHVLLSVYTPNEKWAGKTILQIAELSGKDAITVIQEVVSKTHGPGASGKESVVVTAMDERDLRAFIQDSYIMFCSDGDPGGTHPRGAGAYPRVLSQYVRKEGVLRLEDAIRKMTSLPARRFGIVGRGLLRPGFAADVVIFDPKTIIDKSTTSKPDEPAVGMKYVFVNGKLTLNSGSMMVSNAGILLLRPKL